MAVINYKKTIDHISDWLKDYITKSGKRAFIVNSDNDINSALVMLLCKNTNIPTFLLNPYPQNDIWNNFCQEYDIENIKINLSDANESITEQTCTSLSVPEYDTELRSYLLTSVLSYYSHLRKGLIVGTSNRNHFNLLRSYKKYGNGCVDLNPICDLFKSEVEELLIYLSCQFKDNKWSKVGAQILTDTSQSIQDLFKIRESKIQNLTHDEIEWADRQAKNIIKDEADPVHHSLWITFTSRQKIIVAKMYAVEKKTRHKIRTELPCCWVRDLEGLVR